MIHDSERREVAARLRETGEELGSAALLWYHIAKALGVRTATDGKTACDMLADLVEPSGYECVPGECPLNARHNNDNIDRERLLAIATMMAADSVRSVKQGDSVSPVYILHAARNIAEACGETFGSIRNRELAKWGTSIVPKETIVDRDALLALADQLDGLGLSGLSSGWSSGMVNVGFFTRRIRKALGGDE